MEKKTIGSFISTLRKANGMTQKNLAEKLNVSDKTISRWERDEGVPDLTLIPVIAEVFGVTCDELLRGEKVSKESNVEPERENVYSAKAEKQRKRLIKATMLRYKSKTTISIGIALAGLVAAMIANSGFFMARVGFFVAIAFYLVSIICQKIFNNEVSLALFDDEDILDDEIYGIKRDIASNMQNYFRLIIMLIAFTLPLFLATRDSHGRLEFAVWVIMGGLNIGLLAIVNAIRNYILSLSKIKNDEGDFTQNQKDIFLHNHQLKKKYVYLLLPILFVTLLCMFICEFLPCFNPKGIVFNDYESFVEYIETDIYTYKDGFKYIEDNRGNKSDTIEDDERIFVLRDSNNDVMCKYKDINNSVSSIEYEEKEGSILPITVYTEKESCEKRDLLFMKNVVFTGIIVTEVAITVILYMNKRKRIKI